MHCSRRLIVQTLVFSPSYLHRQVSPPGILVVKGGTTWARNGRWILPENARLPRNIQGSFTCRKFRTWDKWVYFHSEGRCAEDFFALNPRTWVPNVSTLRPPKPLKLVHTQQNYLQISYRISAKLDNKRPLQTLCIVGIHLCYTYWRNWRKWLLHAQYIHCTVLLYRNIIITSSTTCFDQFRSCSGYCKGNEVSLLTVFTWQLLVMWCAPCASDKVVLQFHVLKQQNGLIKMWCKFELRSSCSEGQHTAASFLTTVAETDGRKSQSLFGSHMFIARSVSCRAVRFQPRHNHRSVRSLYKHVLYRLYTGHNRTAQHSYILST